MPRTVAAWIVATALICTGAPAARAGSVWGTVTLPAKFKARSGYAAPGFWLLPNDVLEIRPPLVDPRMTMVVVLEGAGVPSKPGIKPELTMEDSRIVPAVLPVKVGQRVTFINKESALHNLDPVGDNKFMAPMRLGRNDSGSHLFAKPGTYHLQCSEVPHLQATVVVIESPQFTLPDANGAFSFSDVPNGNHMVRVWYQGEWIHSQPVLVRGRSKIEIDVKSAHKD